MPQIEVHAVSAADHQQLRKVRVIARSDALFPGSTEETLCAIHHRGVITLFERSSHFIEQRCVVLEQLVANRRDHEADIVSRPGNPLEQLLQRLATVPSPYQLPRR